MRQQLKYVVSFKSDTASDNLIIFRYVMAIALKQASDQKDQFSESC